MLKRVFFKILFCGWLVFFASISFANLTKSVDDRPNIIIFLLDDLGWRDVGPYGNTSVKTPNIDLLAKEGMRFDNAFLTTSSCTASRASILTGLYPHNSGAPNLHDAIPASKTLVSRRLSDSGYYTASIGKWHVGSDVMNQFDWVDTGGGASGSGNWLDTLKNRPVDKPFFMLMSAIDPHHPHDRLPLLERHHAEDVFVPAYLPNIPEIREATAAYYDEISRADTFIGEVLQELEKQNIANNTLVLFMSDNGAPFPRAKLTLYDSGVKTPFIIRWPKQIKPASISEQLVSAIDIAPTLLELAGIPIPESLQGISFKPLFEHPNRTIRTAVYAEQNNHSEAVIHKRSVRTQSYLYIRNTFPHKPVCSGSMNRFNRHGVLKPHQMQCLKKSFNREEFFNVKTDPYQLNNLMGNILLDKSELPKMRILLDQWEKETHDWFDDCLRRKPPSPCLRVRQ